MFQIGTGKPVLGYFSDAAVLHVGAEQSPQHSADLRLALAAAAFNNHHSLSLVAGNQAVADIFLQGGDVLRVEQAIQKLQPENRFWGVGVVGHGETVADDFRLSLHKGSVQKKSPVGKVNPVRLRGKILHQRRQFHQFHNVADFAGNIADRTAFQLLKNFSPQGQFVCHTAFGREKSPVCEDDLVRLQELLTKQGFVDAFAIEPDGHPVKLRFVFHRHRPPFSACPAVPPNRQSGHPCSAFPRFSPAVPVRRQ